MKTATIIYVLGNMLWRSPNPLQIICKMCG